MLSPFVLACTFKGHISCHLGVIRKSGVLLDRTLIHNRFKQTLILINIPRKDGKLIICF